MVAPATGGGSTAIAFAALADGAPDLVAASPTRGDVDVFSENSDGSWASVGSFYAGGAGAEIVSGQIGGRGAVAVRDQGGSVALLGSAVDLPHRLNFPVQVWRRVRNGQPVDGSPPARVHLLADLDGDGSDELIVSTDQGIFIVVALAALLSANPEHPPPANGFRLAGGAPGPVAALDLDGDGLVDLLALDVEQPLARVWHHASAAAGDFAATQKISLPAPGRAAAATDCAGTPALVLLQDGSALALGSDGKTAPIMTGAPAISEWASTGDAHAVFSASPLIYDACGRRAVHLGVPSQTARAAMSSSADGAFKRLALLDEDGSTLSLFRIFPDF